MKSDASEVVKEHKDNKWKRALELCKGNEDAAEIAYDVIEWCDRCEEWFPPQEHECFGEKKIK